MRMIVYVFFFSRGFPPSHGQLCTYSRWFPIKRAQVRTWCGPDEEKEGEQELEEGGEEEDLGATLHQSRDTRPESEPEALAR